MLLSKVRPVLESNLVMFLGSSEQLDTERAVMSLFSDPKEAPSWKTAYFYCLSSSKHFLEQILVQPLNH